MKMKLNVLVASTLALTTLLSPLQAFAAQAKPAAITTLSIPDPGSSFTLIGEKRETFDNTIVNNVLSAALAFIFGKVTKLEKVTNSAGYIIGLTALSNFINTKLSDSRYVYANIRVGVSYNSYLGYYEYVESVVHYKDANFNQIKEVYYAQTGHKVENDVLARYGLRNP
ncbi:hypothetical protein [Paenibacillus agilis]|uniref:Uncharacterized protein n=1 Tax=Paenibacillus agilis TaxID=3020863 RepID=A0A559ID61_9BACL|nr:hypothetical protein [Paenibacillus agilis]TVX85608.1 hypothetical protein FPZ44_24965 [Paenibacillus agilis]